MEIEKTENSQSMWVNSSFVIFAEAYRMKSPVNVRCSLDLNGRLVDVLLKGFFSQVENNTVQYAIEETIFIEGEHRTADEKQCSFSLTYDASHPSGIGEKLSVSGQGTIIDVKKSAAGMPEHLVLRLAPRLTTGKARKDLRVTWKNEDTRLLWSIVIQKPYTTMQELRDVIMTQYEIAHSSANVELKDISAGGSCLCAKSETLTKRFLVNDCFMLFFVPVRPAKTAPFVMLGRRSRTDRKGADGTFFVYLMFTHELDWGNSSHSLTWRDIRNIGSERLRYFLIKHYAN